MMMSLEPELVDIEILLVARGHLIYRL